MSANLNNFIRPCGATDNASDYGSEDSRFESWQGRVIFLKSISTGINLLLKKYTIFIITLIQNIIHNKVKMQRRDAGNYVDKHCTIT
jgi:hypothetical protein